MKIETIMMEDLMEQRQHHHDRNTIQGKLYDYVQQRDPQRTVVCGYHLYDTVTPDIIGLPHPFFPMPVPVVYSLEGLLKILPNACKELDMEPGEFKALAVTYGWIIDTLLNSRPLFLTWPAVLNFKKCSSGYEGKLYSFDEMLNAFNKPGDMIFAQIPPHIVAHAPVDVDVLAMREEYRRQGFKDEQCQCPDCISRRS